MQVSQDEKLSTKQTVDEDRKHAVEASIVRVMKARKTMPHQQLVMEVSQQLMKLFKPDPKVIKNRIESLISREVSFGLALALRVRTVSRCVRFVLKLSRSALWLSSAWALSLTGLRGVCSVGAVMWQYLERDKDNNGVYKYLA